MKLHKPLLILLCAFLTGCISWHNTKTIESLSLPNSPIKKTIALDLRMNILDAQVKSEGIDDRRKTIEDRAKAFIQNSLYDSKYYKYSTDKTSSDYLVTLEITRDARYSVLNLIVFMATLSLIPGFDEIDYVINYKIEDLKSSESKEGMLKAKLNNMYGIFALFASPFFHSPEGANKEIFYNSGKAIWKDIR